MKTEETLIYHKITVATGLLQNNTYGHELVLFCLIIIIILVFTVCLCFIFTKKSVSGYSGFASIDIGSAMRSIARSTDRTVLDPYALNAK